VAFGMLSDVRALAPVMLLGLMAAAVAADAQIAPGPSERAGYGGLHAAALAGDPAAIRRLVAGGENPNARDGHGRTPLMVAAHFRRHAAAPGSGKGRAGSGSGTSSGSRARPPRESGHSPSPEGCEEGRPRRAPPCGCRRPRSSPAGRPWRSRWLVRDPQGHGSGPRCAGESPGQGRWPQPAGSRLR